MLKGDFNVVGYWFLISMTILYSRVASSDDCFVKSTHVIGNMPKLRNQGDLNTCFAFSAVTALDKYICNQRKIQKCEENSDAVSVVGLIANSHGSFEYSNPASVLQPLRSGGSHLPRERCASYFNQSDGHTSSIPLTAEFLHEIRALHAKVRSLDGQLDTSTCNKISILSAKVKRTFAEVQDILSKYDIDNFVKLISVPKECNDEKVPIPAFQIGALRKDEINLNKETIGQLIKSAVALETPVIWSYCSTPDISKCQPGKKLHASIIFGRRQYCCPIENRVSSNCKVQYLVRDSASVVGELLGDPRGPGDYWMDEEVVFERSRAGEAPGSTRDERGELYHSFLWLSPPK